MIDIMAFGSIVLMVLVLGAGVWLLERREAEARLAEEAIEATQLLSDSLQERLNEMDRYRHDLAAVLQQLDIEEVRAAEEHAHGDASSQTMGCE